MIRTIKCVSYIANNYLIESVKDIGSDCQNYRSKSLIVFVSLVHPDLFFFSKNYSASISSFSLFST